MNRDEYLKLHEVLCKAALELSTRKNHDYAGKGGEQPFANFERCEAMGICTTGQGFLVRMTDKLSRLASFEQVGEFKVKDESVKDTVLDIVNYAVLYYAQKQSKARLEPTYIPLPVKEMDHSQDAVPYKINGWDHSKLGTNEVYNGCECAPCRLVRKTTGGNYRIKGLDTHRSLQDTYESH